MKNILVPTDFSDTAKAAFFYARRLAEQMGGADIKLVHVFMPAVESEYPNFVPPVAEFMKVREEMLREFADHCCEEASAIDKWNGKVDRELLIGFPADEISRISCDYDLIVMGTTGASDLLNQLFGSVSSAVARRAKCPTILVPRQLAFKGFQNLLYASNYESANDRMLKKLLEFNQPFRANIHFVHVRQGKKQDSDRTKEEIFEGLFQKGEPSFAFHMAEVESDSVQEGIHSYAEEHDIDLVIMVSLQRSFWESFFHRSQTRQFALYTQLPLMVLHLQEEAVQV